MKSNNWNNFFFFFFSYYKVKKEKKNKKKLDKDTCATLVQLPLVLVKTSNVGIRLEMHQMPSYSVKPHFGATFGHYSADGHSPRRRHSFLCFSRPFLFSFFFFILFFFFFFSYYYQLIILYRAAVTVLLARCSNNKHVPAVMVSMPFGKPRKIKKKTIYTHTIL